MYKILHIPTAKYVSSQYGCIFITFSKETAESIINAVSWILECADFVVEFDSSYRARPELKPASKHEFEIIDV